jgi:hypothetical protein
MAMRAQCSLQFSDKDLYDNFIIPMKQSKELNNIIIKCLTAYFYNEEARNCIEGQIGTDEDTEVNTQQEMINNIRQSLMMQSYMAQEMQDTLANGIDDVSDILHNVNTKAEETGIVHTEKTEAASNILRLGAGAEKKDKPVTSNVADQSNILVMLIERLLKSSGDTEGLDVLHKAYSSDNSENANLNSVHEEVTNSKVQEEVFEENVESDDEFFEEAEIKEPEAEPEPVEEEEDSTDLLDSLLSSIM